MECERNGWAGVRVGVGDFDTFGVFFKEVVSLWIRR